MIAQLSVGPQHVDMEFELCLHADVQSRGLGIGMVLVLVSKVWALPLLAGCQAA